ncbi:MAG: hypothetical protein JWN64_100 [Parcubacteria group bacterium]|nr:hypothetical protein [Parcubacteria group bacterium]
MHITTNPVQRGFTLIEILVVIGMLAILATVVIVSINPMRQFAQARNSQREANVAAILNGIGQRLADNRGIFPKGSCASLPAVKLPMANSQSGFDIRPCLVPTYMSELPMDPKEGFNTCTAPTCASGENYDTGYTIVQDFATARVTVCADGHAEGPIPGSAKFCLSN